MRKWVKFQKYASCSYFIAGRSLQIQNPNFFSLKICQENKQKQRNVYSDECQILLVKLRAAVCWFRNDMKGQMVAHIAQVTCFENILRTGRLIYPNFFFARSVFEMIVLSQSIVSLGEAVYQNAFLSLEFRLNSDLVSSVAEQKFKKLRISWRNKVFWLPGLIFFRKLSLFERELPKNARFRRQLRPPRAQNTKKFAKK